MRKPNQLRMDFIQTKICKDCYQEKPLDNFYVHKNEFGGSTYARYIPCERRRKHYYRINGTPEQKAVRQAENRRNRIPYPLRHKTPVAVFDGSLRKALRRRERKGLPTEGSMSVKELMALWREQEGLCALSGIRMTWGPGKPISTRISMDRIDNAIGYTKDNVRIVCQSFNMLKGQMTDDEMLEMAETLVAKMREIKKPKLVLVSSRS